MSETGQPQLPQIIADHLRQYQQSPREGHLWDARFVGGHAETPTLLLTTVGRKSGKRFTLPLIYGKDADRYIVIGSKGGAQQHPAWYLNLASNPQVEVQVVDEKFSATARTATGAERQRLWDLMSKVYPPYPSYQERTDREIPVVVLERKR